MKAYSTLLCRENKKMLCIYWLMCASKSKQCIMKISKKVPNSYYFIFHTA